MNFNYVACFVNDDLGVQCPYRIVKLTIAPVDNHSTVWCSTGGKIINGSCSPEIQVRVYSSNARTGSSSIGENVIVACEGTAGRCSCSKVCKTICRNSKGSITGSEHSETKRNGQVLPAAIVKRSGKQWRYSCSCVG